jgi:hypothetical protein
MKITRRQLIRLIRETMHDSAWSQDAPDVVKQVYSQGSPEKWQEKFGDNPSPSSSPGLHPSRQIETGEFNEVGIAYWEASLLKDIAAHGEITLDSFVDKIAGNDEEDLEFRETVLSSISDLIDMSKKLTFDRNNNIISVE